MPEQIPLSERALFERTPLQETERNINDTEAAMKGISPHLGAKSIGLLGSFALTVNNISGPGMLDFPAIFQKAGYIPCLLCLFFVCLISSICATLLCDTMARIPGNESFDKRVEFSDIFRHFLGRRWFVITQLAFFLCLLSQNVAAIVSTAQVLDSLVATMILNESYALHFNSAYKSFFSVISWQHSDCSLQSIEDGSCVPFTYDAMVESPAPGGFVLTLGYVLCTFLFLYLGLLNLDENISMQIMSFFALLLISLEFLWCFHTQIRPEHSYDRVPAFGEDWSDCLGVVIFNFAFCVTIPSWVNEKKPSVDINRTIWASTISSTLLYTAVGWLGGLAFNEMPDNMLELLSSDKVDKTTNIFALFFSVFIIGMGIPIFCILMRYNLVVSNVCAEKWGLFWGGIFPWLISWFVYQGHGVLNLLSWSGLILNGFIDFFCPALVSLVAVRVILHQNVPLWYSSTNLYPTPSSGYLQLDNSLNMRRNIPDTIVGALPVFLRPYHESFMYFLTGAILVFVGIGLFLKIQSGFTSL